MYTYEERIKAVKLLIQYDMSYATAITELGYPNDSRSLKIGYKEYKENGDLHKDYVKIPQYGVPFLYRAIFIT